MSEAQLEVGDRVRYIGHADHVAPPILDGLEGTEGTINAAAGVAIDAEDLWMIAFEDIDPSVVCHSDQLEAVEG